MKYVLIGIVAFTLPLAALYQAIVGDLGVAVTMNGDHDCRRIRVLLRIGLTWPAFVGSSNSPVSGITICTILFASLILALLMGRHATADPCDDHDRGGGVLRRLHRRRQSSGPQMRLFDRRIALAAATDARRRRARKRACHGAGAESAAAGLRMASANERPSAIAGRRRRRRSWRRCRAACLAASCLGPW